jgi:hypothetical protein
VAFRGGAREETTPSSNFEDIVGVKSGVRSSLEIRPQTHACPGSSSDPNRIHHKRKRQLRKTAAEGYRLRLASGRAFTSCVYHAGEADTEKGERAGFQNLGEARQRKDAERAATARYPVILIVFVIGAGQTGSQAVDVEAKLSSSLPVVRSKRRNIALAVQSITQTLLRALSTAISPMPASVASVTV